MRTHRDRLVAMSELTRLLDQLNEDPPSLLSAIESIPSVPAEHDKLQHLLLRTLVRPEVQPSLQIQRVARKKP